jgi:predicted aminopeptidase
MRAEYGDLKRAWGGFAGYDGWFEQPLNNAQLGSIAIYTRLVPAFERLLAQNGGDLTRFYAEVKRIAEASEPERAAGLAALSG